MPISAILFLIALSMYAAQLDKWVDEDYDFIHYLIGKIVALNAAVKWEASPKPLIEATLILLGAEGEESKWEN